MLRTLLRPIVWLHRWLEQHVGMPYRLLITVGLLISMAHTISGLATGGWHSSGILSLILQAALFLDTASSLEQRFERRDARRKQGSASF